MSYILEALRKAERERQLGEAPSMPDILSVQPAGQRSIWPWLAASLLLLINVGLLWHFWRNGKEQATPAAPSVAVGASPKIVESPAPETGKPAAAPPATQPVLAPMGQAALSETLAKPVENQVQEAQKPAATAQQTMQPAAIPVVKTENLAPPAPKPEAKSPPVPIPHPAKPRPANRDTPGQPQHDKVQPAMPEAVSKPLARQEKNDEAPLTEGKPILTADQLSAVKQLSRQPGQEKGGDASLPSVNEMPQEIREKASRFKVNVLAYSSVPAERFAIINMVRYTKGQTLPDGAVVREIQANGVVLEMNGRHFRLSNH